MNTQEILDKTKNLVDLLTVASSEIKEIDSKREALIASEYVNTDREKRLNDKEIDLAQRTKDVDSQKTYIDEQNKGAQIILNKIRVEKEELSKLADEKRELEKEKMQFELDKKGFESIKAEKEKFEADRVAFETERQFFAKEKLAMQESRKLFEKQLENIKQREDSLNRREQLIQV